MKGIGIILLALLFLTSAVTAAEYQISREDDVEVLFDKYVDYLNSFRTFTENYKNVPNAIDLYAFLSPLDKYIIAGDVSGDETIETKLIDFNFFYQITPFEWLTLYSYINGIFFAEEFSDYVSGFTRANLISAVRLNTDFFWLHYGAVTEIGFTEISAPFREGSEALLYALGYSAILAPVTIAADIFDSGIRLDMLHVELEKARLFSLLNRSNMYSSSLFAFKLLEDNSFLLDVIAQYAHTAEEYFAGGVAITFGEGEDWKFEAAPMIDLVSYLKEVQLRFYTERFEIHGVFAANKWDNPEAGFTLEYRPNRIFGIGLSYNDNYFAGFRQSEGFSIYGRFHYDSDIYSLEW